MKMRAERPKWFNINTKKTVTTIKKKDYPEIFELGNGDDVSQLMVELGFEDLGETMEFTKEFRAILPIKRKLEAFKGAPHFLQLPINNFKLTTQIIQLSVSI